MGWEVGTGPERVCLVTGAAGGLGYQVALGMARRGARVLVHGRTVERAEAAAVAVRARHPGARVDVVSGDLSSLAEVRLLAAAVEAVVPQLDVVVNNAGVLNLRRVLTVDGLEMTFAVNHLAPFLLTRLLLPMLEAGGRGRVVTVSSEAHRAGSVDWDNLQGERGYSGGAAYGTSKLLNVLFTFELARRLEGRPVTANCVHPGVISTGLWRGSALTRIPFAIARAFTTSPARGADPITRLALAADVEGMSGGYYSRLRLAQPAPVAFNPDVQARLWEVSERLCSTPMAGAS